MKYFLGIFRVIHALLALLFACAAFMLVAIAAHIGWVASFGNLDQSSAQSITEAVGFLAAAVVALQIAQTIAEEEVIRNADISAPTRIRRFLSRFFVVVIVALAIEGLVATIKAIHEDMTHLVYASSLILATGILLGAWGLFVYLNRSAEEIEPEAMADVKREDEKLK